MTNISKKVNAFMKKILCSIMLFVASSACFASESSISNAPITKPLVGASSDASLGVSNTYIKKNAPIEYTVKKSDSVVKLATMYLTKIGYWNQFLGVDSLSTTKLYPGDKLRMISLDSSHKILVVAVAAGSNNSYYQKLSPTLRVTSENNIPALPVTQLRSLMINPIVMSDEEYKALPMIVGADNSGSVYYTLGDNVYVKNYNGNIGDRVMVLSDFRKIIDPDSHLPIATEYHYNGEGIISSIGKVSNLELIKVDQQISALDRVAPVDAISQNIVPFRSEYNIEGKIVAMYDSLTSTGQNNTVVLNVGAKLGAKVGMVLDITDAHKFVDPTSPSDDPQYLNSPIQNIGELLIYKVYDNVSFALVTDSTKEIPLYAKFKSQ